MNGSLKFKDMFMLLNYICMDQYVKILVQSLTNCKSYGDLYDGVSAFTEHVENHFATFFVERWLNVLCAVSLLEP